MASAPLVIVEREFRARLIVRRWPFIAGGLSVALGTFILGGWLLGHERWTTFVAHLPMTAANSALMAILTGTSLVLLTSRDPAKRLGWLGRACAAAVVVMMGLTLLEFLFNVDLWVDHLLPIAPRLIVPRHPGRPSPQSAVGFALLGLALLALDRRDRAGRPRSEAPALAAALLGLLALLGYVFGAAQLYRPFTLFW